MKDDRFQRFTIKVGIQGLGVFVKENIKKGKVLFKMRGKIIPSPTRTSVQIGKNKHIEDDIAGHVNHHCTPNARVNRKELTLVALRDIQMGEEITFDYNANEEHVAAPFQCACCHRKILGKASLQIEQSVAE